MRRRHRWLLLVLLPLLQPAQLFGAEQQCYQVVNVDMWDVLYIRSKRSHLSKATGAIAPDHTGILRATGPCTPKGASSRKQWCPVDYFPLPNVRKAGFVKAFFIAPAPCPGS